MKSGRCITVFLISALTLALELLHIRIFSVVFWYHLTYFIITMALLGYALSGTFLSFFPKIKKVREENFYIICLVGFSLSVIVSIALITRLKMDNFKLWEDFSQIRRLILSYTLVMFPYFFSGLIICAAFLKEKENLGLIYSFSLGGSALGSFLFLFFIRSLGGEGFLCLISFFALFFVLFLIRSKHPILKISLAICVLVSCLVLFFYKGKIIKILPEKNKQFWTWFGKRKVEFSQWNPISLINVVSEEGSPLVKRILIDGDAQTPLIKVNPKNLEKLASIEFPHREVVYSLFQKIPPRRALVIGAGGGVDVIYAYENQTRFIDAVEINPTIVFLTTKRYSSYIGDIYKRKNVKLFCEDGRSFVTRVKKKYDLIMIYAADTFSALSSGAYILAENYLYTEEAFSEYWKHLTPRGVFQVSRWFYSDVPRETLRVFITACQMLKSQKVENPSSHILVVADDNWADVIISKKKFTPSVLENFLGECRKRGLNILFPLSSENIFLKVANLSAEKDWQRFYNNYPYNVKPVSDDNPFFFQYSKPDSIFRKIKDKSYYEFIRGNKPFIVLYSLLFQSVFLVFLLVWLPFLKIGQKVRNISSKFLILLYFALLGLSFMFIEIALTQKLILFLGSPIYSLAVVLPTIFIFAGLGSLLAKRFINFNPSKIFILFISIGIVLSFSFFSAKFKDFLFLLPYFLRVGIIIIYLAGLSFFMGLPFSLGIQRLSFLSSEMIPLAWAVNGGFSVIGSVLSVILAILLNFSFVLSLAIIFYIYAGVLFLKWSYFSKK